MNVHRTKRMWDEFAKASGFPSIAEYLRARYVDEQMSLDKLGLVMGVRRVRVAQMLRSYDIPVRNRGGVR